MAFDRLEPISSISEKCPVTPCIYGLEVVWVLMFLLCLVFSI